MFQFNYTITEDDYIAFNMHYLFDTKFGKRTSSLLRLLIPLCCISIFLIISFKEVYSPFALTIVFIICVLWVIFLKKIMMHYTKWAMRKRKKAGVPVYSEKGTFRFEEDFILDSNPMLENKISYNLVENIYMTSNALYIFYNVAAAFILPYRFIENQATFNALVDFLQAKTNKQVINIGTKK